MEIKTSILRNIEKPARYITPSITLKPVTINKDAKRILILFPDLFEVGQSHTGVKILYSLLKQRGFLVDFGFAFKNDIESFYRSSGKLESSLHSIDYRTFDMICVSFQYQLQYPTFLRMLDVAGIPLYTHKRDDSYPLIIAGGPVMCNPEPIKPFIDMAFIGEVEPVIDQFAGAINKSKEKADLCDQLSQVPGIYCPHRKNADSCTAPKRVILENLEQKSNIPQDLPIYGMRTVHDRYVVEIQRGCTRGCRFCMAGMIYRPHRERTASCIIETLDTRVSSNGFHEASFLSLSAGDHSQIEDMLLTAYNNSQKEFSVSLPSLRTETLTDDLVSVIKKRRKGGFTLAPESGSERLRNVINKCNTTQDLIASIHKIFKSGYSHLKLYFMIGLPTEQMSDLEETILLIEQISLIARIYGKKHKVTVSFSTFVPQPFTPFQWERMITFDEIDEKQQYLIENLKKYKNVKFDFHDKKVSTIEGVLSRSSDSVAPVLEGISQQMSDLQTWREGFDYDIWKEMLNTHNISIDETLQERDVQQTLPFEHIDIGVTRDFLLQERGRAFKEEITKDCAIDGICVDCGVCDHQTIKNIRGRNIDNFKPAQTKPVAAPSSSENTFNRGNAVPYLFLYEKRGKMISMGHLDTVEFLLKGFTMIHLPVLYSEGFHPTPRFSLQQPLPVGVEALEDYGVIWLTEPINSEDVVTSLNNMYQLSGVQFKRFISLQTREQAKIVEKQIRENDIPWEIRFDQLSDLTTFIEEHESAITITSKKDYTVNFIKTPKTGSVFKLLKEAYGNYHVIRHPYLNI